MLPWLTRSHRPKNEAASKRPRRLLAISLLSCVLGVGSIVGAQEAGRQLHEYFEAPASSSDLRRAFEQAGGAGDAATNRTLPPPQEPSRTPGAPPPLTLSTSEEEPILSKDGPRSSQELEAPQGGLDPLSAENRLDSQTDRVDQLNYFSSFDPSVIPYKRGVSQNSVDYRDGQYVFSVDSGRFEQVPVSDSSLARDGEDVFWGTHLLNAERGVMLPIPSVGPEQRVLEIQTEPVSAVEVFKDRADNYMLRLEHQGLIRVNIKIAVPNSYFTAAFPNTSWSSFDARRVIPLPGEARRQAARVMETLGIDPNTMSPRAVLMQLIEHFRDFEGKPLDTSNMLGSDLYYTIATGKTGVCRHRSFAFVLTASALGIPTRYVYNEAHAFVEVHWPRVGWRRIDLGGAAQDLLQHSSQDHQRVHDPGQEDNLPQPESFMTEIERLAKQQEERRAQQEAPEGDGTNGGFDVGDGPMSQDGNDTNAAQGAQEDVGFNTAEDPSGMMDENPFLSPETQAAVQNKQASSIYLFDVPDTMRRGEAVNFSGRLVSTEDGSVPELAGQKLRVVLVAPGSNALGTARSIGSMTSDTRGDFQAEVTVPRDLPMGRWSLFVVFDGNESYAPAQSD